MAERKQLKILCIHGYRQNAQTFKEKTGAFRKIIKKFAEPVFITAPHQVPPGNMGSAAWADENVNKLENGELVESSGKDCREMGWWFSREDDYFKSTDHSDFSKGFEESVEMIIKVLEDEEHGGFDGILGFSQGASLVSMLCVKQQQENKKWFKFAILIAGFKSRSTKHSVYYEGKAMIPSLHVYGDTDQIISTEMSEELFQFFENPKALRHPGGHFVPASGPQKKDYLEFLEEMSQLCIAS